MKNWFVDMLVHREQIAVDMVVGNMVLGGQNVETVAVDVGPDTLAVLALVLRSLAYVVYALGSDFDREIACVVLDHAEIWISHFLLSRFYVDSGGHCNVCCVLSVHFVLCHGCGHSLLSRGYDRIHGNLGHD